jgi:hypothetical protein
MQLIHSIYRWGTHLKIVGQFCIQVIFKEAKSLKVLKRREIFQLYVGLNLFESQRVAIQKNVQPHLMHSPFAENGLSLKTAT